MNEKENLIAAAMAGRDGPPERDGPEHFYFTDLVAVAERTAAPELVAGVETHSRACESCRRRLESLRRRLSGAPSDSSPGGPTGPALGAGSSDETGRRVAADVRPAPGAGAGNSELDIGRYRDYLLLLARNRLSPRLRIRQDPSDVVNQTLLDAHKDRGQFRGATAGEMAAWLRQILTHNLARVARDETRQKRDVGREIPLFQQVEESSVMLASALADPGSSPSQGADRNEQLLRLAGALTRLPEGQREAVELRYLHRWPVKDIAEHLERTPAAVSGLIHRGLSELQTMLGSHRPE